MGQAKGTLYIISCAAGTASSVPEVVKVAQAWGWEVCVVPTPNATDFLDLPLLEQWTGHAVRSHYRKPDEPDDPMPRADALLVFPATFNTINKWALGICDTRALSVLCEYTGLKTPIVAVPTFRTGGGLDMHPAFARSVEMLRSYSVHVFYEPATYPPRNHIPAEVILGRLEQEMHK
jgi:phosphopantothenoylcysteine synthetase/decarboxylase